MVAKANVHPADAARAKLMGQHLQDRLGDVGIHYRTQLQQRGFSRRQVQRIYQGEIESLRLETLTALAKLFDLSAWQLLQELEAVAISTNPQGRSPHLDVEPSSETFLRQTIQRQALETLESFLRFWPTAAYAAQQNPTAPAVKLLPLIKPVMTLLSDWDVRAIAEVGAWVNFDPTLHQSGVPDLPPGTTVRVTHQGYVWGNPPRLLFRAQVVPGQNNSP
ncbi:helix-turn-helix domain-containing protein [Candidatus Synechococcus calcipolaris G9]|uniref:Helix-turn-helix domain-containing protein n=1 Tax=Candidatus Synechococcus calcipolaris G9 TaxID=1497997 RepID=A0ABT6F1I4_9SYNE|nr:helix-turn-helix domain-containing protein [Candidatus Synechococcus calcipolaris]MDG2991687.1 helix-turn-helix domain-containing protein [Candidatus Synechococcus calcipolaris G9]